MKRPPQRREENTCTLCGGWAVKHLNLRQCSRNPRHIADLVTCRWFNCTVPGEAAYSTP